jgi:hypothetical protein
MGKGSSARHVVSAGDWDDFVAICYFGRDGDWLDRCMWRAYLDMNRTLHGMSNLGESRSDWQTAMLGVLRSRLTMLLGEHTWTQASFDTWHHALVDTLKRISLEHGFSSLSVGQAQKWINMSIKYAIALGERRAPGFYRIYDVAHVALDNVVLGHLEEGGMPALNCAWSRLNDYARYMECQHWVRDRFRDECPLEVEYRLWQGDSGDAGAGGMQKEVNDG